MCVCVCPSVCEHSHGRISWSIFTKIGTGVRTRKVRTSSLGGQYRTTPSPILPARTPILGQEVLKTHANIKYCYIWLKCTRIAKIFPTFKKSGSRKRWWRQILDRKWKYGRFAHAQWKIRNITLIYGRINEIFALNRKSGSRNTMVTSDFRPEVEIRPFCACAMNKNAT